MLPTDAQRAISAPGYRKHIYLYGFRIQDTFCAGSAGVLLPYMVSHVYKRLECEIIIIEIKFSSLKCIVVFIPFLMESNYLGSHPS